MLVLEGNVETYKEERGMFYKPSKNVCSGLFLVNTFPEMYSFKKTMNGLTISNPKKSRFLLYSKGIEKALLDGLDSVLKMNYGS